LGEKEAVAEARNRRLNRGFVICLIAILAVIVVNHFFHLITFSMLTVCNGTEMTLPFQTEVRPWTPYTHEYPQCYYLNRKIFELSGNITLRNMVLNGTEYADKMLDTILSSGCPEPYILYLNYTLNLENVTIFYHDIRIYFEHGKISVFANDTLACFKVENAKIYSKDFEAEVSYTYFVIRGGVG
jgi:hypothetical protein